MCGDGGRQEEICLCSVGAHRIHKHGESMVKVQKECQRSEGHNPDMSELAALGRRLPEASGPQRMDGS